MHEAMPTAIRHPAQHHHDHAASCAQPQQLQRLQLLELAGAVEGVGCNAAWAWAADVRCDSWVMSAVWHTDAPRTGVRWLLLGTRNLQFQCKGVVSGSKMFVFESRILTCLTYTSRRGSQHRGQTAEQDDTKARKAKLQRPRTAAQGSLSHKQHA
jgi:hypothetical protein